jgi:hypothetical protein
MKQVRARLDRADGPAAAHALRDGLQDVDLDHDLGADDFGGLDF